MQQSIISNINKIDYSLKTVFENVKITEKSSKEFGNYFLVEATNSLIRDDFKPYVVKIAIPFKNLVNENSITWSYFANPNKETDAIQRTTNGSIIADVLDIIQNKKFDKEYLESIDVSSKSIYSLESNGDENSTDKEYVLDINKSSIESLFRKENIHVENLNLENLIDKNKLFPTIKYKLSAKISPFEGMNIDPSSIAKIKKELSNLPLTGDNFSFSMQVELDTTNLSIVVEAKDGLSDVKIID